MWNCSVDPIINNSETFKIIHGDESFDVDKLRFALFSEEIKENFANIGDSLRIDDSVCSDAVKQLSSIITNGNYDITKENVFDLLGISFELRINAIKEDLTDFIEDNFSLDEIIAKINETPRNSLFSGLKICCAHKLDSALLIPQFAELDIDKLTDILTCDSAIYSDHHLLFSFVMDEVAKHKEQSLPLLQCIDLRRLNAKEAEQLFACEALFNPKDAENYAISDLGRIEQRIADVNQKMKQMPGTRATGKMLNEKFDLIQEAIEEVANVIDTNEERSYEKVINLKDRLSTIQRRVKNDGRRTRADFKTIQTKIKSLDTKIQKEFPTDVV